MGERGESVRIAVSGTHRVGKTTLARAIADVLPGHDLVDEPYHDLVAEGHVFSHPPGVEDFEEQLEHSLTALSDDVQHVVFDRCPVDLLAYLVVASRDGDDVVEHWRGRVRRAMQSLDAVILVPVESPDRIEVTEDEDPAATRQDVDETLRDLLLSDRLDLDVRVVEVHGSLWDRATTAVALLAEASGD